MLLLLTTDVIYYEIFLRLDLASLKMLLCTSKSFKYIYNSYHRCKKHKNCKQQIQKKFIKCCIKNGYLNILKLYKSFGLSESLEYKKLDEYCKLYKRPKIQIWLINERFDNKNKYIRDEEYNNKIPEKECISRYNELISNRQVYDREQRLECCFSEAKYIFKNFCIEKDKQFSFDSKNWCAILKKEHIRKCREFISCREKEMDETRKECIRKYDEFVFRTGITDVQYYMKCCPAVTLNEYLKIHGQTIFFNDPHLDNNITYAPCRGLTDAEKYSPTVIYDDLFGSV